mmetsp:Transcript_5822/g.20155  ORF Transcript_5822/g.20155 Transcript_5822/m.20155 type:complete len:625 (+) Transcript_5822:655-2529(+)
MPRCSLGSSRTRGRASRIAWMSSPRGSRRTLFCPLETSWRTRGRPWPPRSPPVPLQNPLPPRRRIEPPAGHSFQPVSFHVSERLERNKRVLQSFSLCLARPWHGPLPGGPLLHQVARDLLPGLLEELHEVVEDPLVCHRQQRHGVALLPSPARSTDPVGVGLDVVWHVVVHDLGDVIHVNSPSRHVSRNQNAAPLRLELLDRGLPLVLGLASVEHNTVVSKLLDLLGHRVALALGVDEDDALLGVIVNLVELLLQLAGLLVLLNQADRLSHVRACLARPAYGYNHSRPQVLLREALHCRRHRGTEHVRRPVHPVGLQFHGFVLRLQICAWHRIQNSLDLGLEPHVDHPVRLVQHNVVALVQHRVRALKAVQQAARGRNHNLTPSPQLRPLLRDALPSHDANHTVSHVLGELGRLLLNLLGELSGWRQDDCIGAVRGDLLRRHRRLFANVGKHGKHKSAGLSRPGLRHPDHVPLLQPDRHGRHLDRARLLVPSVPHTPQDGLWHGPGGVVPAPERPRDPGPLERDAVVLPEDPPVPLRHLLQGLVAPAPVVAQARALAHPRELVSTPPAPSEEKGGLHGPLVQRIRIRRRVFRRVPVELELVPVARLPGLALLLLLPEVLSLDGL